MKYLICSSDSNKIEDYLVKFLQDLYKCQHVQVPTKLQIINAHVVLMVQLNKIQIPVVKIIIEENRNS